MFNGSFKGVFIFFICVNRLFIGINRLFTSSRAVGSHVSPITGPFQPSRSCTRREIRWGHDGRHVGGDWGGLGRGYDGQYTMVKVKRPVATQCESVRYQVSGVNSAVCKISCVNVSRVKRVDGETTKQRNNETNLLTRLNNLLTPLTCTRRESAWMAATTFLCSRLWKRSDVVNSSSSRTSYLSCSGVFRAYKGGGIYHGRVFRGVLGVIYGVYTCITGVCKV